MRRDEETVHDIVHAAREIADFTRGMSRAQFESDRRTLTAVLYEITVIGEAAKRLSAGFRQSQPQLPWTDIAGMRDRVIHHYDEVDLQIVWETVQKDVPELMRLLGPLLPPQEREKA